MNTQVQIPTFDTITDWGDTTSTAKCPSVVVYHHERGLIGWGFEAVKEYNKCSQQCTLIRQLKAEILLHGEVTGPGASYRYLVHSVIAYLVRSIDKNIPISGIYCALPADTLDSRLAVEIRDCVVICNRPGRIDLDVSITDEGQAAFLAVVQDLTSGQTAKLAALAVVDWIWDKSSQKPRSLCPATVESWPKSGEVNLVGASMINEGIKRKMVELDYFSAWEERCREEVLRYVEELKTDLPRNLQEKTGGPCHEALMELKPYIIERCNMIDNTRLEILLEALKAHAAHWPAKYTVQLVLTGGGSQSRTFHAALEAALRTKTWPSRVELSPMRESGSSGHYGERIVRSLTDTQY
ncbi:hypothetical protein LTR17_019753 [Elasticomyces elasticus]|nr:hypothetical protein LTR17_019753 [Elasticomyces elasticus]